MDRLKSTPSEQLRGACGMGGISGIVEWDVGLNLSIQKTCRALRLQVLEILKLENPAPGRVALFSGLVWASVIF